MANEVVRGLFGFSPDELSAQRQAMDDVRAFQMAQLSPLQQTAAMGFQSGNRVARAAGDIGRSLFNVQDPEVAEQAMLSGMAKELYGQGVDPMSTRGLSTMIQRLNASGARPQTLEKLSGALQAAQMREAKLQSEQALAAQRMREGRANLPREVQIAQMLNDPEVPEEVKKSLRELAVREKAQNSPEFVKLLDARDAAPEGSTRRKELDRLIQAEIEGRGKRGTTTITNQLPGAEDIKDVPKFRKAVQDTIKPYGEALDAAEKALLNVDEALKNANPIAFNTAVRGLAKAVDGGTISNKDVQDAGGDPSLIGRISDWGSILFKGVPTDSTVINLKRTIQAMEKVARQKRDSELSTQRDIAKRAGFSDEDIELAFRNTDKKPKKQTRKTASGIEYTVEE